MFPSEIYARILYFCDAQTTLNALCVPDIYDSVGPILLVQAHARRNAKTWCNSLRRIPAQYHDLYIRTCLEWGADVRANNDYAVRWASENGHLETVKYLVSQGANIRANDDCAMRWASRNGHLETVKYLVSTGSKRSSR